MTSPRTFLLATAALAIATVGGVASAEAGARSNRVAERIANIQYQVEDLRSIRSPHRRDAEIDRLQSQLDRLEARSSNQRGRLARQNDAQIDQLQRRLARLERRNDRRGARFDRRFDRFADDHGGGYGRHGRWGSER